MSFRLVPKSVTLNGVMDGNRLGLGYLWATTGGQTVRLSLHNFRTVSVRSKSDEYHCDNFTLLSKALTSNCMTECHNISTYAVATKDFGTFSVHYNLFTITSIVNNKI